MIPIVQRTKALSGILVHQRTCKAQPPEPTTGPVTKATNSAKAPARLPRQYRARLGHGLQQQAWGNKAEGCIREALEKRGGVNCSQLAFKSALLGKGPEPHSERCAPCLRHLRIGSDLATPMRRKVGNQQEETLPSGRTRDKNVQVPQTVTPVLASSGLHCCNVPYVGPPLKTTGKLHRVPE